MHYSLSSPQETSQRSLPKEQFYSRSTLLDYSRRLLSSQKYSFKNFGSLTCAGMTAYHRIYTQLGPSFSSRSKQSPYCRFPAIDSNTSLEHFNFIVSATHQSELTVAACIYARRHRHEILQFIC